MSSNGPTQPSQIPLAKAYLISFLLEALLHGIYVVLFFSTVYLIALKREKSRNAFILAVAVVALYALSATHFGLNICQAFTLVLPQGETSTTLSRDYRFTYKQIAVGTINCLVANCIMVWRSWVIWGHVRILVAITLVLALGFAAASVGLIISLSIAPPDALFSNELILGWSAPTMVLTFAINLWYTSLIAAQARQHYNRITELLGTRFVSGCGLVILIIESGVLYCIFWLVAFAMFKTGQHAVFVVLDVIAQLTGIYPTVVILLIILRASFPAPSLVLGRTSAQGCCCAYARGDGDGAAWCGYGRGSRFEYGTGTLSTVRFRAELTPSPAPTQWTGRTRPSGDLGLHVRSTCDAYEHMRKSSELGFGLGFGHSLGMKVCVSRGVGMGEKDVESESVSVGSTFVEHASTLAKEGESTVCLESTLFKETEEK